MLHIQNYINGQLCPPQSGLWLNNYNPALGSVFAQVPNSGASDVDAAVMAAKNALPQWAALTAAERAGYLLRIAGLIEEHLEALATDEVTDNGKTITQAREVDIPRAASNFRFFAEAVTQFKKETFKTSDTIHNEVLRQPLGVVAAISPWNLPLYLFTWKIAPALATGNTVVAKPSEITPLTAFRLSELCIKAGLPPGVLNIVHGEGGSTGNALIQHKQIKAITFTGSTAVGKHIASVAAPQLKKISLELGGKNPALVFADCDVERTVKELVRASFSNQGEICLCSSRLLVQDAIFETFKNAFVAQAKAMPVGNPMLPETRVGAIVSKTHFDKIGYYLQLAREEGGTILCGGEPVNPGGAMEQGWFVPPTVIEGLNNQCRTNREEIFGPVVTLIPFKTEEEAIALANDNDYGLSATIWTTDTERAQRVAQQVEAGVIWVNCWLVRDLRTPFGGMKNSGVGREGGDEALRFFTEPKNVCTRE
ncbi:MAG: aldehyde dehydrogenase [Dinghuibacter sp.]|nr:aldehyde dehydrogenase [Dinghuibacter sp.]